MDNYIFQTQSINEHWQSFIDFGTSDSSQVRKVILHSWQRCLQNDVDPFNNALHHHLQGNDLSQAIQQRERLINVAQPFMDDLYTIVKGTGFVVALSNESGYIIKILGDDGASEKPMTSNFFIGASWHEKDAGTNAIGTALEERKPIQVSGAEHYCQGHHCLTCSAAPIFDPEDQLIGILDISGSYESAHRHTLGMVVAAAKAIIAQLRIRKKNHQLAVANKKLVSFFNMVSDGVLILDKNGIISELNPAAERIFGQNRSELTGTRLSRLLNSDETNLKDSLNGVKSEMETEVALETAKGPCQCLASTEPIFNEQEVLTGRLITLRPVKAVQHMVHRYSGYSASLLFSDIIGQSHEMQEAIDLAKLSAQSASNVLLQGESGTGKEIFAQAIHNRSSRRGAPFIPLNCGAIPRELVGSELFGYEDGAFTGARKGGKPGKFELASGGTLFLDEIGDMPLEQQAVLLRVIQEKRMTRIGGIKDIPVNVRLICATHKNLLEKVHKGTFRQDLYYRLNVMSITIPPLRDRIEDIPLLFRHFLDALCRDRGQKVTVSMDLMHYLYAYPWPGNVRELQNVVERATNLAVNGVISIHQLPAELFDRQEDRSETRTPAPSPPTDRFYRQRERQQQEKQQIIQLLNIHYGNVTEVARKLGVSRKTIYNRMHRYAIAN
jgi:sigma-54 dependent transcriptional regulator, acetoin dehydrogenase operon transcriptional activator AcoR